MEIKNVTNESLKFGLCTRCGVWSKVSKLFQQTNDPDKRAEHRAERQAWLDEPLVCDKETV